MKTNRYINALLAFMAPGLHTASQSSTGSTAATTKAISSQADHLSPQQGETLNNQRENFIALIKKTIEEIQSLPQRTAATYAIISDISDTIAFTDLSSSHKSGNLSRCFLQYTVQLCQAARAHGCLVIFVSARHERRRAETEKVLAEAGFEKGTYVLYLRPTVGLHTGQWKGSVRSQIAAQKSIIATIDDSEENLDATHGPTGRSILVPPATSFHATDFFSTKE